MILSPVGKHRSISSICNQFLRKLSYIWIKIIHDVMDDTGSLYTASRIEVIRIGFDWIAGSQTIHVDVSVGVEFISKFRSQLCM